MLSCSSPSAPGTRLLREGEVIDRALREGEEHLYEIELPAGQSALVVADKAGIDLSLRLYRLDGSLEVGLERPNLYYGEERLTVLAEPSTTHRKIGVKATTDPKRGGRYTLRIARVAPTTAQDEALAQAERAFSLAYNAEPPITREARLQRAELYEQALARLERVGDWELASFAAAHAFSELHLEGELARALALEDRAIVQATRTGSFKNRVSFRISRGKTLFMLRLRSEAEATWHLAEEEAAVLGQSTSVMEARLNLVWYLKFPHNPAAALRELEALWKGDGRNLPAKQRRRYLTILAEVRLEVGDVEAAEDALAEAEGLPSVGDEEATVRLEFLRGRVALRKQDLQTAERAFASIYERLSARDDVSLMAMTLIARAQAVASRGDSPGAESLLLEALRLGRDRRLESVEFLASTNLAWVRIEWGVPARALDPAKRALEIAEDFEGSWLAGALFTKARVMMELDQLEEADQLMTRCLGWAEDVQSQIAAPSLQSLFSARNQDYYELASEIRHRLALRKGQAWLERDAFDLVERSRARAFLAYLKRARVDPFEEAPTRLRQEVAELDKRIEVSNMRWLEAREREDGTEEEARALLMHDVKAREKLEVSLVEESGRFRFMTDPRVASVSELQASLEGDTRLIAFSIAEPSSIAWIVGHKTFTAIELPGRSVLARPIANLRQSLAAGDQRRMREVVRADLDRLSNLLLRDVISHLKAERLIIVPDEGLHAVPFAALSDPAVPHGGWLQGSVLLDRFEIVQVPSATVYLELARRVPPSQPWMKRAVVIGDPIYARDDGRLTTVSLQEGDEATSAEAVDAETTRRDIEKVAPPRLFFAAEEIEALRKLIPEDRRVEKVGLEATRENLLGSALHGFDLVHIVAHGVGDDDRPDLSGLELSRFDRTGREVPGVVRPSDLYRASMNAELVVLSACRSGLGREIPGEGLVGIGRAFHQAGARRVLASLWDVGDSSTARLMEGLYEALLERGLPPAAALRDAQRRLRADPRFGEPYFWAAFILQGDS